MTARMMSEFVKRFQVSIGWFVFYPSNIGETWRKVNREWTLSIPALTPEDHILTDKGLEIFEKDSESIIKS